MDEIYVIERHYIRGGEGVSDKVHWRGKYEIKEYSLPKFKVVDYDRRPFDYVDTSKLSAWDLMIHNFEKAMWEQFDESASETVIRQSHEKHPSTYRNGIKKLTK